MIPKVIHYCWFGNKKMPDLAVKCLESWKKNCPDYKIVKWSEENFDINICNYVREAYESEKYAFVSDYVRIYVLVHFGGIYMDTDVEVIKPIDRFLREKAFIGFESFTYVSTGIIGAEKGLPFFMEILERYHERYFIGLDGKLDMTTNVAMITDLCYKYGLIRNNTKQNIAGLTLYPKDYFCPKDYITGIIDRTVNTYTVHHFTGSWLKKVSRPLINLALDKIKKASQIYLYGAGEYAEECLKILDTMDVAITGVVVTRPDKKDTFYGHKIIGIDCVKERKALMLIAVHEQYYQEIVDGLKNRGFRNFIYVCE